MHLDSKSSQEWVETKLCSTVRTSVEINSYVESRKTTQVTQDNGSASTQEQELLEPSTRDDFHSQSETGMDFKEAH